MKLGWNWCEILNKYKDNHISFYDDVTMNHNGKLQNGVQPATCICKKLKITAYFITMIVCILAYVLLRFCCSSFRFKEIANISVYA